MSNQVTKQAVVKPGGSIDPNKTTEVLQLFDESGDPIALEDVASDYPAPPESGVKHLTSDDGVISWEDIESELPPIEEVGTYILKTVSGVLTWVSEG